MSGEWEMKTLYFDNAASTPVDPRVVKAMLPYFTHEYGNASSVHSKGREAKNAMERARHVIAKSIGARTSDIVFTSGGTESNNLALKGLFFANYPEKDHIITTKIEHDCVLNSCKWLESRGARVTYLDVDSEGFVNLDELEKAIDSKTLVVSIIHGNNEIGTIQDLKKIGEICKNHKVLLHTDACQSYTKVPINVKKMNLSLVTLNAHKIHGPKGVGALYIKEGTKITTLAHGGGHEKKLRSGTENIPGIVGFAESVKIMKSRDIKKMEILRDEIIEGIMKIPDTKLNGPKGKNRLCNNIDVSLMNIEGEAIGGYLEDFGIQTSTGSACMSHSLEPSHVLQAIGLSPVESNSSIRISINKYTTDEDVKYFLQSLYKVVKKLRRLSPLVR